MATLFRSESWFGSTLLVVLMATLLGPLLIDLPWLREGLSAGAMLVLCWGVWMHSSGNLSRGISGALLVATVILRTTALATELPWAVVAGQIAQMCFLAFTAYITVWHLISASTITVDTVLGAICGYVLLGITWGMAFAVVEALAPGSFSIRGELMQGETGYSLLSAQAGQLYYFSLVTLTTLGYGDILPVTKLSGMLAAWEAVTGQLYIAILVARIVSMRITSLKD